MAWRGSALAGGSVGEIQSTVFGVRGETLRPRMCHQPYPLGLSVLFGGIQNISLSRQSWGLILKERAHQ